MIPFSGAGTRSTGGGGCPVVGSGGGGGGGGGCPVISNNRSNSDVVVDARNLMPSNPDANAAAPGQRTPLPTSRQRSSIPMSSETDLPEHQRASSAAGAGAGDTKPSTSSSSSKSNDRDKDSKVWVYPSQQMFYNAMRRKGWSPDERDMESVVAIHNAVNERAWQEVVAWEAAAGFGPGNVPCGGPRLARFVGRPRDLSPKARLLNFFFGYRLPFDRHDWYVDRCGGNGGGSGGGSGGGAGGGGRGKRVRYVIDFYNAAATATTATASSSATKTAPVAMHLDVRPALDSPEAAWERLKAAFGRVAARWTA